LYHLTCKKVQFQLIFGNLDILGFRYSGLAKTAWISGLQSLALMLMVTLTGMRWTGCTRKASCAFFAARTVR